MVMREERQHTRTPHFPTLKTHLTTSLTFHRLNTTHLTPHRPIPHLTYTSHTDRIIRRRWGSRRPSMNSAGGFNTSHTSHTSHTHLTHFTSHIIRRRYHLASHISHITSLTRITHTHLTDRIIRRRGRSSSRGRMTRRRRRRDEGLRRVCSIWDTQGTADERRDGALEMEGFELN